MSKAEKNIENKTEGECEIRKFHVIYFDFTPEMKFTIEHLWDNELYDDYESAYYNGFIGDWEGNLYILEINGNFFSYIQDKINEWMDGDETTEDSEPYQKLYDFFKKYEGYSVYVDIDKKLEEKK
jgi:hypothetical protein